MAFVLIACYNHLVPTRSRGVKCFLVRHNLNLNLAMSRNAASSGSGARSVYRRPHNAHDEVNNMAGEEDASDLDIANIVERELQTDNYISGL
jgi:hypothetical protein